MVAEVLEGVAGSQDALLDRMVRCLDRSTEYLNRGRALAPTDLDDLTQEAFGRAWEALPRYRGESSLETWLAGFAWHTYHERLRERRRLRRAREPVEDLADELAAPLSVASPENVLVLREALAGLSDAQRDLVLARVVDRTPFRRLAERWQTNVVNIRQRFHRALAVLRAAVDE